MDIYLVGGAVRDLLLNKVPVDKDYVVVGSNKEEMIKLGFSLVGNDFPVFLHPTTGEEYALARKETKIGIGYQGFVVDFNEEISLKEDLFRRDLTINAMAINKDGKLIDYFNGESDLKKGILKHVSIHFKEDPVRILRICRFAARYKFNIHEETLNYMRDMVKVGEFESLTNERVWQEINKTMIEDTPSLFWQNLLSINAIYKLPGFNEKNIVLYEKKWSLLNSIMHEDIKDKIQSRVAISFLYHDLKLLPKQYRIEKEQLSYISLLSKYNEKLVE